jgi:geranylgeranyl reductase family protein
LDNCEVIVVGAGPAGAVTAYSLARAGARVVVLEKARLPRYKPCGGGVTFKTAQLLDFDISPVVEQTITAYAMADRMGRTFRYDTGVPLIYMVMRDRFDHLLVKRAQEVGAEVLEGSPVRKVEVGDQGVAAVTREGRCIRAKVMVGADGASSVVARALGLMQGVPVGVGLENEVRVSDAVLSRWQNHVLFDAGTMRWGYGWVFPKGDHLSIGVGGLEEDWERLRRYRDDFMAYCRSLLGDFEILHSQGHRLPVRQPNMPIFSSRALLVGDAAGLVNPADGEGIYYGIRSAQIAARFVLEALARPEVERPDFASYQRAIDAELMPELSHACKLMRMYTISPRLCMAALRRSRRARRTLGGLLRGETRYADVYQKLGSARWLLERASLRWGYQGRIGRGAVPVTLG